jgi:hypothetical protein
MGTFSSKKGSKHRHSLQLLYTSTKREGLSLAIHRQVYLVGADKATADRGGESDSKTGART